jgi:NDP-4-keto-2,6-dideoxyhexose 3-C-methyltransferase
LIGEQFPSAVFLSEKSPPPIDFSASSLNITRCANSECSLIQLSNQYNLQYVFDHYPYESGTTATMKQILQEVVDDAQKVSPLVREDVVLDIGGNDGTLLGLINSPVRARVNIDAATGILQTISDPNYHHIHAKFDADTYLGLGLPSPKLITSIAMFYHLSDPLTFIKDIARIMDDNTIWVLQMTYVGTMLRDNILDNIVHEHVAYYSLHSLKFLLLQANLHIADAKIVDSYGGSLRVFIVKNHKAFPGQYWQREISSVEQFEKDNETNTFAALYAFDTRVQLIKETLGNIVRHIAYRKGPLWGFGASTKGNMILQLIDATVEQIPCILDNGAKKIGSKTTGTLIPIVAESEYLSMLPQYIIILPYYYKDTFTQILKRSLKSGKSLDIIIPLPYPHFLTI